MPHVSRTFTDSCGPFLQSKGFSLDPDRATDAYQSLSLVFTNDKGFMLSFSFLPNDGKYAEIRCGRRWSDSNGSSYLSGRYCDLAKRFGYSLPKTYSLDGPEKTKQSLSAIEKDIAESLPAVLTQMNIEDIEAIEREHYGALRFLQFSLRRTHSRSMRVSNIEFED